MKKTKATKATKKKAAKNTVVLSVARAESQRRKKLGLRESEPLPYLSTAKKPNAPTVVEMWRAYLAMKERRDEASRLFDQTLEGRLIRPLMEEEHEGYDIDPDRR